MPIYAYRCDTCGFQQDVLRKMSDPLLVDCPSCGASTFRKQVTAAGFQLKGSGWYVTDFRNPAGKEGAKASGTADADGGAKEGVAKPDTSAPAPAAPAESGKQAPAAGPRADAAPKASPPPATGTS